MDNIGGVKEIEVVDVDNITSFAIYKKQAYVKYFLSTKIQFSPGTVSIKTPAVESNGVTIHNIEIEMKVPIFSSIPTFAGRKHVVLAHTNAGITYVLGSCSEPLLASEEPMIPGVVTEYHGRIVRFSGETFYGALTL